MKKRWTEEKAKKFLEDCYNLPAKEVVEMYGFSNEGEMYSTAFTYYNQYKSRPKRKLYRKNFISPASDNFYYHYADPGIDMTRWTEKDEKDFIETYIVHGIIETEKLFYIPPQPGLPSPTRIIMYRLSRKYGIPDFHSSAWSKQDISQLIIDYDTYGAEKIYKMRREFGSIEAVEMAIKCLKKAYRPRKIEKK